MQESCFCELLMKKYFGKPLRMSEILVRKKKREEERKKEEKKEEE